MLSSSRSGRTRSISCSARLFCITFQIAKLLRLIDRLRPFGRRALIVLDLERHPMAYHFFPLTKRLFGWSALTVHDGPVSVAAGFRPEELGSLSARRWFCRRHGSKTLAVVPPVFGYSS